MSAIDVRTPAEFAEVHVPQTRSVPLDQLKPSSLPLQKDQPVYLFCQSGQRATKVAEQFAREGFTQSVVVEGGTLAWIAVNLPVTRSAAKVISLERQVRIATGAIVFAGVLLAHFVNFNFIWLSGFSRCRAGVRRDH